MLYYKLNCFKEKLQIQCKQHKLFKMPCVTLLLTGVPHFISLKSLSYNLDSLFNTDEIGSFRSRYLPNHPRTNQRQIALDFQSGFDAMAAQEKLDGYKYELYDGNLYTLSAKINKVKEYMRHDSFSPDRTMQDHQSGWSTFGMMPDLSYGELTSANSKLDAQLELLKKQKLILEAERELLIEKKRLKREYGCMVSSLLSQSEHSHDFEYTAPKRFRSRSREPEPGPSRRYSRDRESRECKSHSRTKLTQVEWDERRTRELRSNSKKQRSKSREIHSRDLCSTSREPSDLRSLTSKTRARSKSRDRRSSSNERAHRDQERVHRDRRSTSRPCYRERTSRSRERSIQRLGLNNRSPIPQTRPRWDEVGILPRSSRDVVVRRSRTPDNRAQLLAIMATCTEQPQTPRARSHTHKDNTQGNSNLSLTDNNNIFRNKYGSININNNATVKSKLTVSVPDEDTKFSDRINKTVDKNKNLKEAQENKALTKFNNKIKKEDKLEAKVESISRDVMFLMLILLEETMLKENIRISNSNKTLLDKTLHELIKERVEPLARVRNNSDVDVLRKYKLQFPKENDILMLKKMLNDIPKKNESQQATPTNMAKDATSLKVDDGSTAQQEHNMNGKRTVQNEGNELQERECSGPNVTSTETKERLDNSEVLDIIDLHSNIIEECTKKLTQLQRPECSGSNVTSTEAKERFDNSEALHIIDLHSNIPEGCTKKVIKLQEPECSRSNVTSTETKERLDNSEVLDIIDLHSNITEECTKKLTQLQKPECSGSNVTSTEEKERLDNSQVLNIIDLHSNIPEGCNKTLTKLQEPECSGSNVTSTEEKERLDNSQVLNIIYLLKQLAKFREPECSGSNVTSTEPKERLDNSEVLDIIDLHSNIQEGCTKKLEDNANNLTRSENKDNLGPRIKEEIKEPNEAIVTVDIDNPDKHVPKCPQFLLVIKSLLKDMMNVRVMKNNSSEHILSSDLQYVLRQILTKLMKGHAYTPKNKIINLFRALYPKDKDDQFIKDVIKDIKDGKYPGLTGYPATTGDLEDDVILIENKCDVITLGDSDDEAQTEVFYVDCEITPPRAKKTYQANSAPEVTGSNTILKKRALAQHNRTNLKPTKPSTSKHEPVNPGSTNLDSTELRLNPGPSCLTQLKPNLANFGLTDLTPANPSMSKTGRVHPGSANNGLTEFRPAEPGTSKLVPAYPDSSKLPPVNPGSGKIIQVNPNPANFDPAKLTSASPSLSRPGSIHPVSPNLGATGCRTANHVTSKLIPANPDTSKLRLVNPESANPRATYPRPCNPGSPNLRPVNPGPVNRHPTKLKPIGRGNSNFRPVNYSPANRHPTNFRPVSPYISNIRPVGPDPSILHLNNVRPVNRGISKFLPASLRPIELRPANAGTSTIRSNNSGVATTGEAKTAAQTMKKTGSQTLPRVTANTDEENLKNKGDENDAKTKTANADNAKDPKVATKTIEESNSSSLKVTAITIMTSLNELSAITDKTTDGPTMEDPIESIKEEIPFENSDAEPTETPLKPALNQNIHVNSSTEIANTESAKGDPVNATERIEENNSNSLKVTAITIVTSLNELSAITDKTTDRPRMEVPIESIKEEMPFEKSSTEPTDSPLHPASNQNPRVTSSNERPNTENAKSNSINRTQPIAENKSNSLKVTAITIMTSLTELTAIANNDGSRMEVPIEDIKEEIQFENTDTEQTDSPVNETLHCYKEKAKPNNSVVVNKDLTESCVNDERQRALGEQENSIHSVLTTNKKETLPRNKTSSDDEDETIESIVKYVKSMI